MKRLNLRRETLTELGDRELELIAGGASENCPSYQCPQSHTCPQSMGCPLTYLCIVITSG